MYQYLSGRLRQLGILQSDLGERMGLSPAAISRRFTGVTPWTIDEIYDVLEVCRATPDEFQTYFPSPNHCSLNAQKVPHAVGGTQSTRTFTSGGKGSIARRNYGPKGERVSSKHGKEDSRG